MNYFLTQQNLIDNYPISANTNINDYIFNIKLAAELYVKPLIGTYFYEDLLTKFNSLTCNNNELNLIDIYFKPIIAWHTVAESVITVSYELKNKGIQTQTGEFSANAEYKELMFLHHHYSDKANAYENLLVNYLSNKTNADLFPNFINDLNNDSRIKNSCSKINTFNTNIFFI